MNKKLSNKNQTSAFVDPASEEIKEAYRRLRSARVVDCSPCSDDERVFYLEKKLESLTGKPWWEC